MAQKKLMTKGEIVTYFAEKLEISNRGRCEDQTCKSI